MISPKSALSADRPFVGLRPYCFEDQEFFFGRGDQIFSLYRLLDHSRFVSVVGSSGSGKSSLVRAGLLPLLDRESHEPKGRAWKILQMHPGDYPIGSLATSIAQQLSPNGQSNITAARRERIRFALGRSSFGLADALRDFGGVDAASVVLVVDQFEELFRYTGRREWPEKPEAAERQEEAIQFVQLLLAASRDRALNVYVLLTMRSDFIGECAAFGGLPEAVSAAQFLVPALTRDQGEQAIRCPIEKARARIEPALVERLLNESGDDIDQLPVLQHCLARLWEQARCDRQDGGRCLTVQHYLQVGGMAHALSRHADKLLVELSEKKLAVEQIFRSLAEIDGEGRIVRRARLFNELLAETGVPTQDLRAVVDRFRDDDNSFLTPGKSEIAELTAAARIDVGHEALLRRWERVSGDWRKGSLDIGWVRGEERDGRIYRGLLAMAEAGAKIGSARFEERWQWWKERPRTSEWAKRYGGNKEEVERLFSDSLAELRAEAARKDAEQAAERRRIELEAEAARARDEAEKTRLELAAQTARERELNALRFARLARRFAIGVTGLLCFTIALGVATYVQRQTALKQKQNTEQSLTIGGNLTRALLEQLQKFLDNGGVSIGAVKSLLNIAQQQLAKLERIAQTPATLAARSNLLLAFADLSMALQDSNSALQYSQQARSLATQLVDGKAGNDANQNLLYSADFRIGDAQFDLANFDAALHAYNEALAIVQDLAAKKPANYLWTQDAAFVINKIGDIWKIKGNNEEVLKQYQTALSIDQKLVHNNPRVDSLKRDLATTLTRIGDLQDGDGDLTDALKNYQNALSIRKELSGRNPNDASIQSNLSVAYNAVANVLVKQQKFEDAAPLFNEAMRIRNQLADGDPTNTLWQNYLAYEYVYIGKMLLANKDFSGAIKNYRQSLDIRSRLSGHDPNNFTWLKNLADSHTKLAEALYASGESTSALNEHRAALAIRVKIGALYSESLTRQRELIAEYIEIAGIVAEQGDSAGAVVNYQSAGGVIGAFLGRHPGVKSLDHEREVVAEKIKLLGPSQAASP